MAEEDIVIGGSEGDGIKTSQTGGTPPAVDVSPSALRGRSEAASAQPVGLDPFVKFNRESAGGSPVKQKILEDAGVVTDAEAPAEESIEEFRARVEAEARSEGLTNRSEQQQADAAAKETPAPTVSVNNTNWDKIYKWIGNNPNTTTSLSYDDFVGKYSTNDENLRKIYSRMIMDSSSNPIDLKLNGFKNFKAELFSPDEAAPDIEKAKVTSGNAVLEKAVAPAPAVSMAQMQIDDMHSTIVRGQEESKKTAEISAKYKKERDLAEAEFQLSGTVDQSRLDDIDLREADELKQMRSTLSASRMDDIAIAESNAGIEKNPFYMPRIEDASKKWIRKGTETSRNKAYTDFIRKREGVYKTLSSEAKRDLSDRYDDPNEVLLQTESYEKTIYNHRANLENRMDFARSAVRKYEDALESGDYSIVESLYGMQRDNQGNLFYLDDLGREVVVDNARKKELLNDAIADAKGLASELETAFFNYGDVAKQAGREVTAESIVNKSYVQELEKSVNALFAGDKEFSKEVEALEHEYKAFLTDEEDNLYARRRAEFKEKYSEKFKELESQFGREGGKTFEAFLNELTDKFYAGGTVGSYDTDQPQAPDPENVVDYYLDYLESKERSRREDEERKERIYKDKDYMLTAEGYAQYKKYLDAEYMPGFFKNVEGLMASIRKESDEKLRVVNKRVQELYEQEANDVYGSLNDKYAPEYGKLYSASPDLAAIARKYDDLISKTDNEEEIISLSHQKNAELQSASQEYKTLADRHQKEYDEIGEDLLDKYQKMIGTETRDIYNWATKKYHSKTRGYMNEHYGNKFLKGYDASGYVNRHLGRALKPREEARLKELQGIPEDSLTDELKAEMTGLLEKSEAGALSDSFDLMTYGDKKIALENLWNDYKSDLVKELNSSYKKVPANEEETELDRSQWTGKQLKTEQERISDRRTVSARTGSEARAEFMWNAMDRVLYKDKEMDLLKPGGMKQSESIYAMKSYIEELKEDAIELHDKLFEQQESARKYGMDAGEKETYSFGYFSGERLKSGSISQKLEASLNRDIGDIMKVIIEAESALLTPDNDEGFWSGVKEGMYGNMHHTVPFLSSMMDVMYGSSALTATGKMQDGVPLNQLESLIVNQMGSSTSLRDMLPSAEDSWGTTGYNVGAQLSHMVAYIGEFASTLGAASAVGQGVKGAVLTGVKKKLKSSLTKKVQKEVGEKVLKETSEAALQKATLGGGLVDDVVKRMGESGMAKMIEELGEKGVSKYAFNTLDLLVTSLAQSTMNPQQYLNNTIDRMTPEVILSLSGEFDDVMAQIASNGEDFGEAFYKGFGMTWAEMLTEQFGEKVFSPMFRYIAKGAGKNDFIKRIAVGGWLRSQRFVKKSDAIKKIMAEKLGYHGIINEYLEEFANARIQSMITGDSGVFDIDKQQEMETFFSVAIFGGGSKVATIPTAIGKKVVSRREGKNVVIGAQTLAENGKMVDTEVKMPHALWSKFNKEFRAGKAFDAIELNYFFNRNDVSDQEREILTSVYNEVNGTNIKTTKGYQEAKEAHEEATGETFDDSEMTTAEVELHEEETEEVTPEVAPEVEEATPAVEEERGLDPLDEARNQIDWATRSNPKAADVMNDPKLVKAVEKYDELIAEEQAMSESEYENMTPQQKAARTRNFNRISKLSEAMGVGADVAISYVRGSLTLQELGEPVTPPAVEAEVAPAVEEAPAAKPTEAKEEAAPAKPDAVAELGEIQEVTVEPSTGQVIEEEAAPAVEEIDEWERIVEGKGVRTETRTVEEIDVEIKDTKSKLADLKKTKPTAEKLAKPKSLVDAEAEVANIEKEIAELEEKRDKSKFADIAERRQRKIDKKKPALKEAKDKVKAEVAAYKKAQNEAKKKAVEKRKSDIEGLEAQLSLLDDARERAEGKIYEWRESDPTKKSDEFAFLEESELVSRDQYLENLDRKISERQEQIQTFKDRIKEDPAGEKFYNNEIAEFEERIAELEKHKTEFEAETAETKPAEKNIEEELGEIDEAEAAPAVEEAPKEVKVEKPSNAEKALIAAVDNKLGVRTIQRKVKDAAGKVFPVFDFPEVIDKKTKKKSSPKGEALKAELGLTNKGNTVAAIAAAAVKEGITGDQVVQAIRNVNEAEAQAKKKKTEAEKKDLAKIAAESKKTTEMEAKEKKTRKALEKKKAAETPEQKEAKEDKKRLESDIETMEIEIENLEEEIKNEKANLKTDLAELRKQKAKVRKSKKTASAKEEAIEELDAEIEDLKAENEAVREGYQDDIKALKADIRSANREMKALDKIIATPVKAKPKAAKKPAAKPAEVVVEAPTEKVDFKTKKANTKNPVVNKAREAINKAKKSMVEPKKIKIGRKSYNQYVLDESPATKSSPERKGNITQKQKAELLNDWTEYKKFYNAVERRTIEEQNAAGSNISFQEASREGKKPVGFVETEEGGRIEPEHIPFAREPQSLRQTMFDLTGKLGIIMKTNEKKKGKRVKTKDGKTIIVNPYKNWRGYYNQLTEWVKIRFNGDLDTIAHEVGHFVDGTSKLYEGVEEMSPVDKVIIEKELPKLWVHGSKPNKSWSKAEQQKYRIKEGIAEYIRAWSFNQAEAEAQFPKMTELFNDRVTPEVKEALAEYGTQVAILNSSNFTEQQRANLRMTYDKNTEGFGRVAQWYKRDWINPKNGNFGLTFWDSLNHIWATNQGIAGKAIRWATERKQAEGLLPQEILPADDPMLGARLILGFDSTFRGLMEDGLMDHMGRRLLDTDPKTKAVSTMNARWLIAPFKSSSKYEIDRLRTLTAHYMVAQRTIEKGEHFKREINITGVGAGLTTDVAVAEGVLNELSKMKDSTDPKDVQDYETIKEGARRYRKMAAAVMQYMADKGRFTQESVKKTLKNNEHYVALHRIVEMDNLIGDTAKDARRKRKNIASVSKQIKITGGSREISDPYANLFEVIYKGIREADRNEVMKNFVDIAGGTQIAGIIEDASDVKGDKIRVFRDGIEETWEFHPEVASYLKGINDVAWQFPGFVRYLPSQLKKFVTGNPVFAVKNVIRDSVNRLIISRSKLSLSDYKIERAISRKEKNRLKELDNKALTDPLTKEEQEEMADLVLRDSTRVKKMLVSTGADQSGYYMGDRVSYYTMMEEVSKNLAAEGNNIFFKFLNKATVAVPYTKKWNDLMSVSEVANRRLEYKAVFNREQARLVEKFKVEYASDLKSKKMSMDDIKDLANYHAMKKAAFESRDLMDFAVMGTAAGFINQVVPFFNPAIQGTVRSIKAFKESPLATSGKVFLFSVVPSLFEVTMAAMGGYDEELNQLPGYQRDMFWNFRVGPDFWIRIPKPFELGLFGSAASRIALHGMGHKNAYDGLFGSVWHTLVPLDRQALHGGFSTLNMLTANWDYFRERNIVPYHEDKLMMQKRNPKYASTIGQWIQKAGADDPDSWLSVDARQVDFFIKTQFAQWGVWGLKLTDKIIPRADEFAESDQYERGFDWTDAGLFSKDAGMSGVDYQYVKKTHGKWGLSWNNKHLKTWRELTEKVNSETDPQKISDAKERLRKESRRLRDQFEMLIERDGDLDSLLSSKEKSDKIKPERLGGALKGESARAKKL